MVGDKMIWFVACWLWWGLKSVLDADNREFTIGSFHDN